MKRPRKIPLMGLLLVLALAAAACSSDDDSGDTTTTTTVAGETTTTVAGETTTTTEGSGTTDPPDTQPQLTIVFNDIPVAFNPFPETAGMGPGPNIQFPNLLENDSGEIVSQVLESWVVSDDAKTVTLGVRPNVEWSDGVPLTSADVVTTLELHLDTTISSRATRIGNVVGMEAFAAGETDTITGITAPDDMTVVVQLETPDVAWIPNLASLSRIISTYPDHYLGDVPHEDIPTHPFFKEMPVGLGAYLFVQYVDGQFYEMKANTNWWKGAPGFEKLFIKFIPDTDAMTAQLQTGEIQFMTGLPAIDAERLGGLDGIAIDSATGQAADMFQLSWDDPLLADPRVRKAMLYAINRVGICEQALLGFCSTPLENQRLIGLEWAVPTDVESYPYDPDKARALLAEAGWVDGTKITFLHRPGISAQDTAVTIAQANLADVGIDFVVENVDVPTLLDRLDSAEDRPTTQAWMNAGANFTMDPSSVQPYASCGTEYPNGPNLSWFCREDVNALWEAGRLEADQTARGEIYKEAFRIMNQDPNELYIFIADNIVAYDDHLRGLRTQGDTWNQYWNVGDWYWEE